MTQPATRQYSRADYTVACICPMGVELAAVLGMLDSQHAPLPARHDHKAYQLGTIGHHNVAVAGMPETGSSAAANVAAQLVYEFPAIRFTLLVGIGGGVPGQNGEHDIRLGDVVVSKPSSVSGGVIQYDLGKRLPAGQFKRTGYLNKPPRLLLASVELLGARHRLEGHRITAYIDDMISRYPRMAATYSFPKNERDQLFNTAYTHQVGPTCESCDSTQTLSRPARPDSEPQIHYGNIGSANVVVKDAEMRDALRSDMDVICIDMEAAGIMDSFPCLVIRGISDYADSHKNSKWQPYASAAAAGYMKELLSIIPAQDVLNQERAREVISNVVEPQNTIARSIDHRQPPSRTERLDQPIPPEVLADEIHQSSLHRITSPSQDGTPLNESPQGTGTPNSSATDTAHSTLIQHNEYFAADDFMARTLRSKVTNHIRHNSQLDSNNYVGSEDRWNLFGTPDTAQIPRPPQPIPPLSLENLNHDSWRTYTSCMSQYCSNWNMYNHCMLELIARTSEEMKSLELAKLTEQVCKRAEFGTSHIYSSRLISVTDANTGKRHHVLRTKRDELSSTTSQYDSKLALQLAVNTAWNMAMLEHKKCLQQFSEVQSAEQKLNEGFGRLHSPMQQQSSHQIDTAAMEETIRSFRSLRPSTISSASDAHMFKATQTQHDHANLGAYQGTIEQPTSSHSDRLKILMIEFVMPHTSNISVNSFFADHKNCSVQVADRVSKVVRSVKISKIDCIVLYSYVHSAWTDETESMWSDLRAYVHAGGRLIIYGPLLTDNIGNFFSEALGLDWQFAQRKYRSQDLWVCDNREDENIPIRVSTGLGQSIALTTAVHEDILYEHERRPSSFEYPRTQSPFLFAKTGNGVIGWFGTRLMKDSVQQLFAFMLGVKKEPQTAKTPDNRSTW